MGNVSSIEKNRSESNLDATRRGLPGVTRLEWTNRVRIGDQIIKFDVLPLNTLGTVILEAQKKMVANSEEEVADRLRQELPDLSEEEIFKMARAEVEKTKKELESLPSLVTFLERNKDKIQEIAPGSGVSYGDDKSGSLEGYFTMVGIPQGAEHYFLTTITDRDEITNLMKTNLFSGNSQYTVREFYSSSVAGNKEPLGFKVFKNDSSEEQPEFVFIFAEDESLRKKEVLPPEEPDNFGADGAANTNSESDDETEQLNLAA